MWRPPLSVQRGPHRRSPISWSAYRRRQRSTGLTAGPSGWTRPGPPCSAHACRSWSCLRRHVRPTPGLCGCRGSLQQVRGEAIPKTVAGHPLAQPGAANGLRDGLADGAFVGMVPPPGSYPRIDRQDGRWKDPLASTTHQDAFGYFRSNPSGNHNEF